MAEQNIPGTQVAGECVGFVSGGKTYHFTVDERLSTDGRLKSVLVGRFVSKGSEFQCNETAPEGVKLDVQYCLKMARAYFPLGASSHPQERQFWDFFPFKGANLREVVALNDDALLMSQMLKDGTLDPIAGTEAYVFNCAVIEPVYKPFNIEQFQTYHEKLDCMLQIVAGLKQLMAEETLQRLKIVAHRDLKFSNVVVEEIDGTRRLRIIDFPSVKYTPRNEVPMEDHTCLGFFSYCNTAPEDVISKYDVSSKTDVFALGTMLAELFEIWNYGGVRNPLRLLFQLANNINGTDTIACRDFYNALDKKYPYDGINNPNWLEFALSCHEKNASWEKVLRVCPDLRMLFRAATAINPRKRISLQDFEKAIRQTYERLPEAEKQLPETVSLERVTYFLVDTTDLDAVRHLYVSAIEQVMTSSPATRIAVLQYGCHDAKQPQIPDPSPLVLTPKVVNEVLREVREMPSCPRGIMQLSGLKGYLYDLSGYLGNETNRRSFNGEIHIFAPEAPDEKNTCYFGVPSTSEGGAPVLRAMTGQEVAQTFGATARIYVHTFRENTIVDGENWYTPVYFSQEKPTTEVVQPIAAEQQPTEDRISVRQYKKGVGFHFFGGIPVRRS